MSPRRAVSTTILGNDRRQRTGSLTRPPLPCVASPKAQKATSWPACPTLPFVARAAAVVFRRENWP
jgi:hypothetical protein